MKVSEKTVVKSRWSLIRVVVHERFYCIDNSKKLFSKKIIVDGKLHYIDIQKKAITASIVA